MKKDKNGLTAGYYSSDKANIKVGKYKDIVAVTLLQKVGICDYELCTIKGEPIEVFSKKVFELSDFMNSDVRYASMVDNKVKWVNMPLSDIDGLREEDVSDDDIDSTVFDGMIPLGVLKVIKKYVDREAAKL